MTELQYVPFSEIQRGLSELDEPLARTRLFATLSRINTLYMIARAGSGHIGSSFSCMDLVSWLHLNEMRVPPPGSESPHEGDVYFSSKGHDVPALYSVLIGLGRLEFDLLHRLRRLDGLPGHPDVGTPHIPTNTGSLGMGISKAKGMVEANRLLGRSQRFFVLTGDGELQEGQFWESLATAANRRMGEITAIVDHNKIQSDTWVRDVSDLGNLEAKLRAFGWHVARCDGHDLAAVRDVLSHFGGITDRPKVLIADTVKGGGSEVVSPSSMAPGEWRYRFHSGAPPAVMPWESYDEAVRQLLDLANDLLGQAEQQPVQTVSEPAPVRSNPPAVQRLIPAYTRALLQCAERNPRLVALDADLILDTGLIPFKEKYPERFIECGIAEQDMVSQAGGMALKGILPFVHSFSCFLHARPNEQIYNNATERTRVVYVASLAGLLPAGPGHSHQSVRDISALAAVPGLVMLEPAFEREAEAAVRFCAEEATESCYLRLVSLPWPVDATLPATYSLSLGRGTRLVDGEDLAIFAYGPILVGEALKVAARLRREQGVTARVFDFPWLNRLDETWFREAIAGVRAIIALDNHYLIGGQGDMLGSTLATLRLDRPPRFQKLGVGEIPMSGAHDEVLKAHGLDADSLFTRISQLLAIPAA